MNEVTAARNLADRCFKKAKSLMFYKRSYKRTGKRIDKLLKKYQKHQTRAEHYAIMRGEQPKSQVRINAEKDKSYCPYCLRCQRLVRMAKLADFLWQCKCGAIHDEREKQL